MSKLENINSQYRKIDLIIVGTMQKYGVLLMRYALGIIFIWFGLLKPMGISPAAGLIAKTVVWFNPDIFISILGWWEVLIGIGLIIRRLNRVAIFLLFAQMGGTFLPLILLPEVTFTAFPYGLTLEGQYIIKNLMILGSALVIGGNVREENTSNRLL